MRTQFGKQGDVRETALIEYPLHQYRLFPLVANTFAINAAGKKIVRMWGKNQKKLFVPNNPKLAEVHAFISVMKGLSSWSAFKGIAECR